jgi:fucose permease
VSFAAITLRAASERVFIVVVVVCFVITSVRKLLDTPSYTFIHMLPEERETQEELRVNAEVSS